MIEQILGTTDKPYLCCPVNLITIANYLQANAMHAFLQAVKTYTKKHDIKTGTMTINPSDVSKVVVEDRRSSFMGFTVNLFSADRTFSQLTTMALTVKEAVAEVLEEISMLGAWRE